MALQSTIEARNQPQLQLGRGLRNLYPAFWSREAARDTHNRRKHKGDLADEDVTPILRDLLREELNRGVSAFLSAHDDT